MREMTAGERWQRAGGREGGGEKRRGEERRGEERRGEGATFACDAKNKTCRAASECATEQTFI